MFAIFDEGNSLLVKNPVKGFLSEVKVDGNAYFIEQL